MTAPLPAGLQQAADYIKAGQLQQAQPLLVRYIKQQPDSADAWYLMSQVVPQPAQQIDCLQRVLRFNPSHRQAQARLVEVMTGQSAAPAQTTTMSSPLPTVASPVEEPQPEPIEPQSPAEEVQPTAKAKDKRGKLFARRSASKPIEPEPAPAEFESLRTKLSEPVKEYRKPRRSYKALLTVLVIVVLIAAAGTAVVVFMQPPADAPATTVDPAPTTVLPPTDTPTKTSTPTITPTRFPPTWTPTPPPTARPTRTPTPPSTVDARQFKQYQPIEQAVSNLRGRAVLTQPTRYFVSPDLIEPILTNLLNVNGLLADLPNQARVLTALGLINSGYNLQHYLLNSHLDPTGSFYSPWTHEVYVTENSVAGVQRQAYALESARALLDLSTGFSNSGAYPTCTLDSQHCQAIRALITGDANLITQLWLKQSATAQDRSDVQGAQLPPLPRPDDLAPPFVTRDVNFGRDAGTLFAQTLFGRGRQILDQAYDELPQSTEQILHPEKYLSGEQPVELAAVPLTDTLGSDWALITNDVLGEWHTDLLLSASVDEGWRIPAEAARSAARGWGGDRLQAYYNSKTNETVLTIAWTWDSVADAREFNLALAAYLDRRFNDTKTPQTGGACWQVATQTTCLFTKDQNSLWLLAPQQSQIDALKAAYTAFP